MIHPRTVFLAVAASLAIGLATAPSPAYAGGGDTPSDADIAAAKKAFLEGKKAFDGKKFDVAVEKFKESYRLSKKPTLLYNIALALESGNQKDMALFYYRKFLTDAPADDAQRPDATDRVKALEAALGPNAGQTGDGTTGGTTGTGTGTGTTGTGTGDTGDTGDTTPPPPPKPKEIKIKPPGTYTAADFKHRVVEEAPPGKPLDLTAVVPEDSGFVVTLFYRGSGEANFTPAPMKLRYNELVGRIPAKKMAGNAVQYWIEVKDPAGTIVTKIAKPSSPNVIYLDSAAASQFYPDWNPDTGVAATNPTNNGGGDTGDTGTGPADNEDPLGHDTDDDPLHAKPNPRVAEGPHPGGGGDSGGGDNLGGGGGAGTGFTDVGSTKFKYTKWGTTAVGGALLATSVFFYFRASSFSSALNDEAHNDTCPDGTPRPCEFDDVDAGYESTGKSAETISKVTFGLGIAVAGVATYFWIKDLRHHGKHAAKKDTAARNTSHGTFVAAPAIGDGVIGGAAGWSW